jgi:hypothetical protein
MSNSQKNKVFILSAIQSSEQVAKGRFPESASNWENYYYVLPLHFRKAALLSRRIIEEDHEDTERERLCTFAQKRGIAVSCALRSNTNRSGHTHIERMGFGSRLEAEKSSFRGSHSDGEAANPTQSE